MLLFEEPPVAGAEWCQMSPFIGGPTQPGLKSWASSPLKTAFLYLKSGLGQLSITLVSLSLADLESRVLSLRRPDAGSNLKLNLGVFVKNTTTMSKSDPANSATL